MNRLACAVGALLAVGLGVGCGAVKPEVFEDFSDLVDEKSDAFSSRMRLVGTLTEGRTSAAVRYSASPRFRAFKFDGYFGNTVEVWVHSTRGDAIAWLLDARFRTLAKNDDANAQTTDARLVVRLPASGTYYVVFRELDQASATFRVTLTGVRAPVVGGLAAFDRLSELDQMRFLYPDYKSGEDAWGYERAPGFSAVPVRLVDSLQGDTRTRAIAAYEEQKRKSWENGGGSPIVSALTKAGEIYAYSFETSGRSYGNWGATHVFDRAFRAMIGFFGASD